MAEERRVFFTRPPHGNGTGDKRAAGVLAVGAASSAEQALGNVESPCEYVILMSTTLCYIRFGLTGIGAATSSDFPIPANTYVRWELKLNEETVFRVIRDAADGFIHWYLPG